jgi:putative chitinase
MMFFEARQIALIAAATVLDADKYTAHLNVAFSHFEITTKKRVAKFLAQGSFESMRLTKTEENLSYSAKRLTQVWPSRFPTLASAEPYARNPRALANKVYGGRMGNTDPDDGWIYRGRGLKQLTGKANYLAAEDGLGMLITGDNAYRVAQPEGAAWTACWFWYANGCNQLADGDDLAALTRRINGGLIGHEDGNDDDQLDDRVEMMQYALAKVEEVWSEP